MASESIAQVVPDIATFAVDDGFSYRVPEGMAIGVGSMVRIPLGSRRVRGYVVGMRRGDTTTLKDVAAPSGEYPVFNEPLLRTLRWAALHYVAPQATLLGRTAPPNLPRGEPAPLEGEIPELGSSLPAISAVAAQGRYARPTYLVAGGSDRATVLAGLASQPLAAGRNVVVISPTVIESEQIAGKLATGFGARVLQVASETPARAATGTWVRMQSAAGSLLVGTPEIALWPIANLGMWVVIGEGRRAMKARQTPTVHVRDLMRMRAAVERAPLIFIGRVPTLEIVSRGVPTVAPAGRSWPFVDIVDRSEERHSGRVVAGHTMRAVASTIAAGGQVFVLANRRGYAAAFRCVRCRRVRRCTHCGSGPGPGDACPRCGAELGPCTGCGGRRFEALGAGIGRLADELTARYGDAVGPVESGRQVVVGTERDLPEVPPTALAVVADADSLLLAPHFRAEEEALRLMVRVADTVVRGKGRRCLVQSAQPDHRVLEALRQGKAGELLEALGAERIRDRLPPEVDLIAIEVTGPADTPARDLPGLVGDAGEVLGPDAGGGRTRWLVQGAALDDFRVRLRGAVQRWRDEDLRVRIDVDPVDL